MLALTGIVLYIHFRFSPHPEWTRKTAHVGSGVVALSFPWLFDRSWPVVSICALAVAAALAARAWPPVSRLIKEVQRDTPGEIYLALIVGTLFVLSGRDPVLYCIPLGVLTLADSAAALVGLRSQRARSATNRSKTPAGSVTFFVIATAVTFAGLSWFTDLAPGRITPIAVAVGIVTTPVEALFGGGLDNLIVPAVCFAILKLALEL